MTTPTEKAALSPEETAPAITALKARRWALIGAGVNVALSVVKIAAGIIGHSYALVADGIESALDVAGSLVIWGALKYAARSPDADHPYGHGKAEPISALVVSGALCVIAVVLAGLSVMEIFSPRRALPAWGALGVLVAVICIKEIMFRKVVAVSESIGSNALRADAWHHRSDAITSVAAFIGILIARVGGPGWESADAWAALFACAVIGFNGLRLFVPALGEIMDAAPPPEIEERVRRAASAVEGIIDLEKCRVRKMGLEYYVDLHAGVDGRISVADGHLIAHEVKDAVRAADSRIADVLVHVEPANLCPYPPRRSP
jgi:cation diffusion facilitator family transporter